MSRWDEGGRRPWRSSRHTGERWDRGQQHFGGTAGFRILGNEEDYRDLGGSGHGYEGPAPDVEGPFAGVGPKGWVRSNEAIREDVCRLMTHDGWLDPSDIGVEVQDGEVTLNGTVPSREQKLIADHLSHRVNGVRDVHNRLTIAPREAADRRQRREPGPTGAC